MPCCPPGRRSLQPRPAGRLPLPRVWLAPLASGRTCRGVITCVFPQRPSRRLVCAHGTVWGRAPGFIGGGAPCRGGPVRPCGVVFHGKPQGLEVFGGAGRGRRCLVLTAHPPPLRPATGPGSRAPPGAGRAPPPESRERVSTDAAASAAGPAGEQRLRGAGAGRGPRGGDPRGGPGQPDPPRVCARGGRGSPGAAEGRGWKRWGPRRAQGPPAAPLRASARCGARAEGGGQQRRARPPALPPSAAAASPRHPEPGSG